MKYLIFSFILVICFLAMPQAVFAAPITNGDAEWNAAFGNWYGVNSSTSTGRITNGDAEWNAAFGPWTSVSSTRTRVVTNGDAEWNASFGNWAGTNTSGTTSDPLAGWSGVNNSGTSSTANTNRNLQNGDAEWNAAFGNWTSVATTTEQLAYNANGYTTSTATNKTVSAGTAATEAQRTDTFRVAPTSGVNTWVPIVFAGMLAVGFAIFRNRKALFA